MGMHMHMCINKVKYNFYFNKLYSLILIFVVCKWKNLIFSRDAIPPKHHCTDELLDNQKTVLLKCILRSGCADMFSDVLAVL